MNIILKLIDQYYIKIDRSMAYIKTDRSCNIILKLIDQWLISKLIDQY